MAVPQPSRIQTVEEIAVFVTAAILLRKPVSAIYNQHRRSLCPHVLGRNKTGELHVLCYQFAGGSVSGLHAQGSPDNWRCICLAKLKSVSLLENETWRTAERHSRTQSCIAEVLFDSEKPIT